MHDYRAGTVIEVVPAGTIVTLLVQLDTQRLYAVHFDHRPFYHMVDDLGLAPAELIGQYVEIIDSADGERVRFPCLQQPGPSP
jgi:hypothetical protein